MNSRSQLMYTLQVLSTLKILLLWKQIHNWHWTEALMDSEGQEANVSSTTVSRSAPSQTRWQLFWLWNKGKRGEVLQPREHARTNYWICIIFHGKMHKTIIELWKQFGLNTGFLPKFVIKRNAFKKHKTRRKYIENEGIRRDDCKVFLLVSSSFLIAC